MKEEYGYEHEIERFLAFVGTGVNSFHINFPNGNHLSTIWGAGTYSSNSNRWKAGGEMYKKEMGSQTVEVMFDCNKRLKKSLNRHFDGDIESSVLGHLDFDQWLDLVNQLAAAPKWTSSPYLKQKKELEKK